MSKDKIILAVVLAALLGFLGWWWWRNRAKANPAINLPPVATLGGTGGAYSGVALMPATNTTWGSSLSSWGRA